MNELYKKSKLFFFLPNGIVTFSGQVKFKKYIKTVRVYKTSESNILNNI